MTNLDFKTKPTKKTLKKFFVISFYLGDKIDLKKFQQTFRKYPYLRREQPIILKLDKFQYVAITKFGTVTFWNVPSQKKESFIKEISPFIENFKPDYSFSDSLKVIVDKTREIDEVKGGRIYLSQLDKDKIQILSYVLSQSVALERYEIEIEQRILEIEKVIGILKKGTWRGLKEKKILKEIGQILAVKQSTISHLSLLDRPETTWERPEIERLYNKLYYEFDLADRLDILNEKIKFLSEHHKTLLDFISAQRNITLELIIVILILIEILIFISEIFSKF